MAPLISLGELHERVPWAARTEQEASGAHLPVGGLGHWWCEQKTKRERGAARLAHRVGMSVEGTG